MKAQNQSARVSAADSRWRDLRRENMLEAAGRVFAREGYQAASIERIAFEAGVGKPTLYRYFANKEALFEAVFVRALDELEDELGEAQAESDFELRIRRMVGRIVPTFRHHLGSLHEMDRTTAPRRRLFRARRADIERHLFETIHAAQSAGEARDFNARLAARFIIGMARSAANSDAYNEAEAVSAISDFILQALRAPALQPQEQAQDVQ